MSGAWPSGRRARSPRDMASAAPWLGGGVVLFDARGERLRPTPLEVKEGDVRSVAFGPEGKIAAGYRRRRTAAAWCSSTPGRAAPTHAAGGQGGRCQERGLRAGGQARRGIWRPAVGGGVVLFDARASGSDPRRWRSRRALSASVAFGPEGKIAAGYRDSASVAWCSSTPIPPRGGGRRGRSPIATSLGTSGSGTSPRDHLPPHDPIPALAA